MAARLRASHQEDVKKKIQASQLINRLQNHANGELEMTSTQVDAAKFLLNKIISNAPNDSNVNLTGEMNLTAVERRIVDPSTPNA